MNVAGITRWLRIAKAVVKPFAALAEAIREARRDNMAKRIAAEKERQHKQDLAMLDRLIREERARKEAGK